MNPLSDELTKGVSVHTSLSAPLQDSGPKLVAVDGLGQIRTKPRCPHVRASRAGRRQSVGWHRPADADMQVLKLGEKLAPGHFC